MTGWNRITQRRVSIAASCIVGVIEIRNFGVSAGLHLDPGWIVLFLLLCRRIPCNAECAADALAMADLVRTLSTIATEIQSTEDAHRIYDLNVQLSELGAPLSRNDSEALYGTFPVCTTLILMPI